MRLDGVRVVVTRALQQSDDLVQALAAEGAEPICLPLLAIVPPVSLTQLQQSAAAVNTYDWVIFTSANAVEAFAAQLPPNLQVLAKIATIGPATRETVERFGFIVSVTPPNYVSEALVDAMSKHNLKGSRILVPGAAVTRDVVPGALRACGATVDIVEAYRNIVPPESVSVAPLIFCDPLPDWVIFASSSAADRLANLVSPDVLGRVKIASIGPITSAAIRKHGLQVTAEASEQTAVGLIEAICEAASGFPRKLVDNQPE